MRDGGWSVSDLDLSELYFGLCFDKTADLIFFDGSIDGVERFIEAAKTNLTIIVYHGMSPVGFGWLNALTKHTATAHFAFLRPGWGEVARIAGRKAIEYWMSFTTSEGLPMFQVLLGTIPSVNRRAIKYVTDIGFEVCGEVPKLVLGRDGAYHSAALVYYARN